CRPRRRGRVARAHRRRRLPRGPARPRRRGAALGAGPHAADRRRRRPSRPPPQPGRPGPAGVCRAATDRRPRGGPPLRGARRPGRGGPAGGRLVHPPPAPLPHPRRREGGLSMLFRDRTDAGRQLARQLSRYAGRPDLLVLALPRGGVPVGYEVARALGAPLDVFVVRKLGVPGREELAMGALATGGVRVLDQDVIQALGIPDEGVDEVTAAEEQELARRERAYRGSLPPADPRGRTVILVDDGLATGSTMRAAVTALRRRGPAHLVVAVPVGAAETCAEFQGEADEA